MVADLNSNNAKRVEVLTIWKWVVLVTIVGVGFDAWMRPRWIRTDRVMRPASNPAASFITPATPPTETKDCLSFAMDYKEPYKSPNEKKKVDLKGTVYATYRWKKQMTKTQIDSQRNRTGEDQIPRNRRVIFKVKDSVLYVDGSDAGFAIIYPAGLDAEELTPLGERCAKTMELLLLTLHLYQIPDMDFVLELTDNVHPKDPQDPVLSYTMESEEGFTIPSFASYRAAFGPQQFEMLKECMKFNHPRNERINKTVWRETSIGRFALTDRSSSLDDHFALEAVGTGNRDLFDIGSVQYLKLARIHHRLRNKKLREERRKRKEAKMRGLQSIPLAILQAEVDVFPFPTSNFSDYAVVLDIDTNGWNSRLPLLLMSDSAVLKREYSDSFDHLADALRSSDVVTFFKWDHTDLVSKAEELVREYAEDPQRWNARVDRLTDFAYEHVSLEGVTRATAFALANYARFQNWKVDLEPGYVEIPRSRCCKHNQAVPEVLIEDMRSS